VLSKRRGEGQADQIWCKAELHERDVSSGEKKRSQMSFSKKSASNTLYTKLNKNDKSVDLSMHIFKYPNLSGFVIFM
jgi:hypothetical protein